MATGVRQEDTDLAVLNAAYRATVLPRDASGVRALFEKARFIDDAHRVWGVEVVSHIGAQPISQVVRIPIGPAQHVLKAIGILVTADLGKLPTIFPFSRA